MARRHQQLSCSLFAPANRQPVKMAPGSCGAVRLASIWARMIDIHKQTRARTTLDVVRRWATSFECRQVGIQEDARASVVVSSRCLPNAARASGSWWCRGGGEGPPKGKSLGRPRPRAQDRAQQPLASLLEYRTCSRANQANASIESERVGRGFECFSVYNLQLEPLGRPRSPLNLASWRLLGSRGGEQAKRKSSVSVVWRWKECVCVCVGVVRWSWWSREH